MIILVNSKITQSQIQSSLGKPEYSYYFLLKEFLPALELVGQVVEVASSEEVDDLYQQYRSQGESVIFLSVSPPHQTPVDLACPTVCMFAWEFDTLPNEAWDDEPRNSWCYVFDRIAGAICTSKETQQLVIQDAPGFPVEAIPAPVWDRYAHLVVPDGAIPRLGERYFSFSGYLIDSAILGLSADGLASETQHLAPENSLPEEINSPAEEADNFWTKSKKIYHLWREEIYKKNTPVPHEKLDIKFTPVDEPASVPAGVIFTETPLNLQVTGVVYTTVLNPADSRKNWTEIITAFCWAFKDNTDAVLVVKMTHYDLEYYRIVLITLLSRLSPFKCRVLVVHGFLDQLQYQELIQSTSFYVNASSGEGLCLPLMEFLSAGCPSLAPTHSAMADYISDDLAFIVDCSIEPFCWPHDPAGIYITHRHRLSWASLVSAYSESYKLAKSDPNRYQSMSKHAYERLRDFASRERVAKDIADFLNALPQYHSVHLEQISV